MDQDKRLTESWAIYQYIALRFSRKDLIGTTDDDKIRVSMVYGVLNDIRTALFQLCFTKGNYNEEMTEVYKTKVIPKLDYLEKYLGKNDWILGSLSICDFILFEVLDMINDMDGSKLGPYK